MRLSNIALAISALYGGFTPAGLFAGGVNGAWYDPSDLTTMFTTSAGTTPVAMPGQGLPAADSAVGAVLDKRAPAYSVFFDGNGDELSAGSSANFAFGTGAYTVEFWVYLTAAVSAAHQPCFVQNNATGGFLFWNQFGGDGLNIGTRGAGTNVLGSSTTLVANQWNHVVAVRSGIGAGQTSIFLNGTRVANGTDATNWTVQGPLQVGGITVPNYYVTGYMSNARVVKGTAVYDPTQSTLTVPAAPLSPISGTSLLTCGTTWSGNPAITSVGNTRVDGLNPFTASPVGNHAVSIAPGLSTSRPVLSARVNLLTYSEDISNAAWTHTNNTRTATTITATATSNVTASQVFSSAAVTTWRLSAKVLKGRSFVLAATGTFSGVGAIFNGTTGAYVNTTSTGAIWSLSSYSCVTHPNDSNYWLATINVVNSASDGGTVYGTIAINNSFGTTWRTGWDAAIGDTLTATNFDLRPANIGAAVPAYQRIADANTYDTAGFPLYLFFDGIDDGMYTPANLDLSNTAQVGVFAGVRKLGTGIMLIFELSADSSANNGSFGSYVVTPATQYAYSSKGTTAFAPATTGAAAYTAPVSNVLTGISDISGDSVILRLNGAQIATNTADQGSGNYGTYPFFIGSRNNANFFFNGHLHGLIVVGSAVSAGNISATESWMAGKTGIQI